METSELRPAFFRFADGRAFSGWKTAIGDIWSTGETLEEAAKELAASGCKGLAAELLLSRPNELGLYLARYARPAFEYPKRLVFTRDVDLHPLDYIEAGERCVCVRRDKISGAVELFMEQYHKRLDADSNCLIIEPHACDEFLGALKIVPTPVPLVYVEEASIVAA